MSSISSSTDPVLFQQSLFTQILDNLDDVQDLLSAQLTCKTWNEQYPFDKKILRVTILNLQVQDPKLWARLNAIMPSIRDNAVYYRDGHNPWQEGDTYIKHILLVQCFDPNKVLQRSWISPVNIHTYCQTKNPLNGENGQLYLTTSAQGMTLESADFRQLRTRGVSLQKRWDGQAIERNIAISAEDLQKIMPPAAPQAPEQQPPAED